MDQPKPKPGRLDITPMVIEDLRRREQKGIETYGTTLQTHNGRKALQDYYEELLDAVQYCKQELLERKDLLVCSLCGNGFVPHDYLLRIQENGTLSHYSCYTENAGTCHQCGCPTRGNAYVLDGGDFYHVHCYYTRPEENRKCSICRSFVYPFDRKVAYDSERNLLTHDGCFFRRKYEDLLEACRVLQGRLAEM